MQIDAQIDQLMAPGARAARMPTRELKQSMPSVFGASRAPYRVKAHRDEIYVRETYDSDSDVRTRSVFNQINIRIFSLFVFVVCSKFFCRLSALVQVVAERNFQ